MQREEKTENGESKKFLGYLMQREEKPENGENVFF